MATLCDGERSASIPLTSSLVINPTEWSLLSFLPFFTITSDENQIILIFWRTRHFILLLTYLAPSKFGISAQPFTLRLTTDYPAQLIEASTDPKHLAKDSLAVPQTPFNPFFIARDPELLSLSCSKLTR